jgi:hypothetical protein
MVTNASAEVRAIAREIERYLQQHPNAADSADGIHRWWLIAPFSDGPLETVEAALDLLEAQGIVGRTVLDSGRVIYSAPRRTNRPTH